MAEFDAKLPVSHVKNHVFEACHHVVKALRASDNNLDTNLRKLLSDLESHLSTFGIAEPKVEVTGFLEITARFKEAEKRILSWETNQSTILEAGLSEANQFFQALYEVQTVLMGFKALPVKSSSKEKAFYNQATVTLDIAMLKLEKELCDVLRQHKQHVIPECLAVSSRGKDIVYDESFVSLDDVVVEEESSLEDDDQMLGGFHNVDPSVLPHIKAIANAMFACDYGQAFREAFINIRREALDEYMATLEMERFSCLDVLQMQWEDLNGAMRKWSKVLKIVTRVYLANEKQLCEQILGDFDSISSSACFVQICKDTILSLLSFSEAVALRSCQPEMLERFLSMYEASTDILLDVDNLFPDETGSFLRISFHELSQKLADCTTATFLNFKSAIDSDESARAFPGGGIHHLTRYVMNYLKLLPEYADSLNSLLQNIEVEDTITEKTGKDILPSTFCPMARHLRAVVAALEASLDRKAQLYADEALKFIFLMNNFHYMVQKVKGSELRHFFGDEWIRKHIALYQHNVTDYERSTWPSVLSLLKENSDSVATLRKRCKLFELAFDDVYKNQSRWSVPDPELRDDLHISISVKVVQSYRGFLARNAARIGEKHIRYTCEDIESLLLDLFECLPSPRPLRSSRRR